MILTGPEIEREIERQLITIEPFQVQRLNPNSYDFRLGHELLVYEEEVLDPGIENCHRIFTIPEDGYVLSPERIYLGATLEKLGSCEYVPIIRARSSTARLGLFVHVTADLIDLGSIAQLTLQLHAVQPVRIYPEMEIGQVTFWRTCGAKVQYSGKYQGSTGPVPSKSYKDWCGTAQQLGGKL